MSSPLGAFLEATVRTAAPLAFASLGELLVERAGMINIGLEGVILAGAFGGVVGASAGGVWIGFGSAIMFGTAVAALFGAFAIWLRADQIITGTAITMLALGATGMLYRAVYGATGAALSIATSGPSPVPLLSRTPVIGTAFFAQPPVTYLLYALVPLTWWWLYRTHAGLALRAIGESPEAAAAAGVNVSRMRWAAVLYGGILGGVAGAMLVLAQAGTFAEGMSAGRGFIAIAIVVLGRWRPVGVALAALVFGAASALQFLFQALGLAVPYQVFLALPYVFTLAGLAGLAGRVRSPASLGRA